jgi:hypothetical protein
MLQAGHEGHLQVREAMIGKAEVKENIARKAKDKGNSVSYSEHSPNLFMQHPS